MCQQIFIRFACSHVQHFDKPCDALIKSSSPLHLIFCDHYTVQNITRHSRCGKGGGYCAHSCAGLFLATAFDELLRVRTLRSQYYTRRQRLLARTQSYQETTPDAVALSDRAELEGKIRILAQQEATLTSQIDHIGRLATMSPSDEHSKKVPPVSKPMPMPAYAGTQFPVFKSPFRANFRPPAMPPAMPSSQPRAMPPPRLPAMPRRQTTGFTDSPAATSPTSRLQTSKSNIARSAPTQDRATRSSLSATKEPAGDDHRRRSRRAVSRPTKYVDSDSEPSAHEKESDDERDDTKPTRPPGLTSVTANISAPPHFASIDTLLHNHPNAPHAARNITPSRAGSSRTPSTPSRGINTDGGTSMSKLNTAFATPVPNRSLPMSMDATNITPINQTTQETATFSPGVHQSYQQPQQPAAGRVSNVGPRQMQQPLVPRPYDNQDHHGASFPPVMRPYINQDHHGASFPPVTRPYINQSQSGASYPPTFPITNADQLGASALMDLTQGSYQDPQAHLEEPFSYPPSGPYVLETPPPQGHFPTNGPVLPEGPVQHSREQPWSHNDMQSTQGLPDSWTPRPFMSPPPGAAATPMSVPPEQSEAASRPSMASPSGAGPTLPMGLVEPSAGGDPAFYDILPSYVEIGEPAQSSLEYYFPASARNCILSPLPGGDIWQSDLECLDDYATDEQIEAAAAAALATPGQQDATPSQQDATESSVPGANVFLTETRGPDQLE